MKTTSKLKKFITNFRSNAKGWQVNLASLILPLVIVLLILSLVLVGIGNHALFHNTKYYESTSILYKVPDFYSLSDMKVDIDKTYYSIKEVVYVFRSVGTQFNPAEGILTQGYTLKMYSRVWLAVGVSVLYYIVEAIKSYAMGYGIRLRLKERKWWGRFFILGFVLLVMLVLEMLVPLL